MAVWAPKIARLSIAERTDVQHAARMEKLQQGSRPPAQFARKGAPTNFRLSCVVLFVGVRISRALLFGSIVGTLIFGNSNASASGVLFLQAWAWAVPILRQACMITYCRRSQSQRLSLLQVHLNGLFSWLDSCTCSWMRDVLALQLKLLPI